MELVKTVLWSGQVEGERPLSLIVVAPPGTGKTSILEIMQSKVSHFFSDFTSREVRAAVRGNEHLTHLMLGDFLALFGHSKSTVKLAINLLSRLTGDTMRQTPWTGEEMPARRMGFITAIPPEDLERREVRLHMRAGGFASRFIVAKFDYSQAAIEKVHKFIREGKYRKQSSVEISIDLGKLLVEVPLNIATKIDALAKQIKRDPIGFRAHHHLRTLACSVARMNKRTAVKEQDYDKVLSFCDFFSEQGKIL
jgi:hypothetical protein